MVIKSKSYPLSTTHLNEIIWKFSENCEKTFWVNSIEEDRESLLKQGEGNIYPIIVDQSDQEAVQKGCAQIEDVLRSRNKVTIFPIKSTLEISQIKSNIQFNPTETVRRGLQRGYNLHGPLRVRAHGHLQKGLQHKRTRTHWHRSQTNQGKLPDYNLTKKCQNMAVFKEIHGTHNPAW